MHCRALNNNMALNGKSRIGSVIGAMDVLRGIEIIIEENPKLP